MHPPGEISRRNDIFFKSGLPVARSPLFYIILVSKRCLNAGQTRGASGLFVLAVGDELHLQRLAVFQGAVEGNGDGCAVVVAFDANLAGRKAFSDI